MKMESHFSKWQFAALVALRMLIGWHFLYEGLAKLLKPGWSAAGFLLESKWILAPVFKWMAGNPTALAVINWMNICGLIAIGLGLIVGCFAGIASLAGIALILLYYLCNPPFIGLYYSLPSEGNYLFVNKNLVEMGALLVLYFFPTSTVWGIDSLFKKWRNR